MKYKEGDTIHIDDGFCQTSRPYDENIDGWRNEMPPAKEFPVINMAKQILDMHDEIAFLRRRNWELKRDNAKLTKDFIEPHFKSAHGLKDMVATIRGTK